MWQNRKNWNVRLSLTEIRLAHGIINLCHVFIADLYLRTVLLYVFDVVFLDEVFCSKSQSDGPCVVMKCSLLYS